MVFQRRRLKGVLSRRPSLSPLILFIEETPLGTAAESRVGLPAQNTHSFASPWLDANSRTDYYLLAPREKPHSCRRSAISPSQSATPASTGMPASIEQLIYPAHTMRIGAPSSPVFVDSFKVSGADAVFCFVSCHPHFFQTRSAFHP